MAYRIPIKLVSAYVFDWFLLLCIAAVGGGISYASPYHRPFSLLDLSISFPNADSEISTAVLVIVSLILPAIIIFIIIAVLVPPLNQRRALGSSFWKRKLWEINAGWMGLGLSWVLAFLITQGIKNIFGKPRPDLLSRCQPDLTDIASHVVGGYGQDISSRWTLISSTICTQTDRHVLDDGFRSFLSGHSSSSWSGLLYLSLWLAVKLNVTLPNTQRSRSDRLERQADQQMILPLHHEDSPTSEKRDSDISRDGSAAPPVFGIIICLIPICIAIYISSTRFADFKHHGFDIISGSVLGIVTALLSFRFYHSSLSRGHAWTWGPRRDEDAWYVVSGSSVTTRKASQAQRRAAPGDSADRDVGLDGTPKYGSPRTGTPVGTDV